MLQYLNTRSWAHNYASFCLVGPIYLAPSQSGEYSRAQLCTAPAPDASLDAFWAYLIFCFVHSAAMDLKARAQQVSVAWYSHRGDAAGWRTAVASWKEAPRFESRSDWGHFCWQFFSHSLKTFMFSWEWTMCTNTSGSWGGEIMEGEENTNQEKSCIHLWISSWF